MARRGSFESKWALGFDQAVKAPPTGREEPLPLPLLLLPLKEDGSELGRTGLKLLWGHCSRSFSALGQSDTVFGLCTFGHG